MPWWDARRAHIACEYQLGGKLSILGFDDDDNGARSSTRWSCVTV